MKLVLFSSAAALCFVAGAAIEGQDKPAFKTESGLVRLDLQVDENGKAMLGLRPEDFLVYDEGEPQTPLYFDVEAEPLDLVLLLDFSGSMEGRGRQVADSGLTTLDMMSPQDRIAVMTFAAKSRILVPLCANRGLAAKALRRLRSHVPGNETDLYAGIGRATQVLRRDIAQRRRAMLVVTDNLGGLRHNEEQMLAALNTTGATVNALILDPGIDARQHSAHAALRQDVTRIAGITGGVSVSAAETEAGVAEALALIRTRYSLYYRRPDAPLRGFHQVKVTLTPGLRERHPDARVSTRAGYWLP